MRENRRLFLIPLLLVVAASSMSSGLCWGNGLQIIIRRSDNSIYYCSRFILDSEEASFLTIINDNRSASTQAWDISSSKWVTVARGTLKPLSWSQTLTVASEFHSQDMAAHNYFDHTSLDGRNPIVRMQAAGYTYNTWLGENIAAGYATGISAFNAWYSSEGHKENMLCLQYKAIGIGRAYNASATYGWYWTTDFGGYDDSGQLWSAWTGMGGSTSSAPTLVVWQADRLYSIVRGTDNGIYCKSMVGGSWSGSWTTLPGATNDAPAIAVLDNKLHLVVRGTDNGIYHRYMDLTTGVWSGWTKISGATLSSPALAISSGILHLVVRGTDNGIYYKYWSASSGWSSSWQQIPGATDDVPAIAVLGSSLHLVIRGTDNAIYHKTMFLSNHSWTGWTFLSGSTLSPPSIVASGSNRLDLVVRGTDNGIYHKSWSSTSHWSSAWDVVGGATVDRPVLAVLGSTLNLAVRGTDNRVYVKSMDLSSGTWTGWTNLQGPIASYPVLVASGS